MVDAKGVSTQIVLITQRPSQLAAYARDLVGMTYMHTKLSTVGRSQSYRVDIYQGCAKGDNPPREQRIREIFGNYKPEVYKLYRSHTMSESDKEGADETPVDQRGVVWRRPSLWIGAIAVVVLAVFGGSGAYAFFTDPTVPTNAAAASGATGAASVGSGVAATSSFATGLTSPGGARASASADEPPPVWRLTAVHEYQGNRDASFAILERGSQVRRVPLTDCRRDMLNGWQCLQDGAYVDRYGATSPAIADPLPSASARAAHAASAAERIG